MECELVSAVQPAKKGPKPAAKPQPKYNVRQGRSTFNVPHMNGARNSNLSFGMNLPPAKKPKVSEAEKELKDSSVKLLAATLGQFSDNDEHKARFAKEVDSSKTVNSLLEDQLGFVGDLHPLIQITMLVGEKFYRTKFT